MDGVGYIHHFSISPGGWSIHGKKNDKSEAPDFPTYFAGSMSHTMPWDWYIYLHFFVDLFMANYVGKNIPCMDPTWDVEWNIFTDL